jgi:flagellar basal body rod protein FlgG
VIAILSEEGYYILDDDGNEILQDQYNFDTQAGDSFADNDEIEAEADAIIDFSEIDPFSEGEV